MTESRRNNLYETRVQDPYIARGKPGEPTVCPDCGAVFSSGRWQWAEQPGDAQDQLCPACSRTQDGLPAGILTLGGDFFLEHEEEIMNLVRNKEEMEKAERPLERIMDIERVNGHCVVSFTGVHLTKSTGTALQHAYKGNLDFTYTDRDNPLRASWER
jgi:hypothetical protein